MTSPFYSGTLLFIILPHTGSQCNQHFGNDKIVYLQSKGCILTANWPLQSFSYFYLVIVFTEGQYS